MESANVELTPIPNVTLYLAAYPQFILTLKILVGTTCVLSIAGALAIIGAYAFILKDEDRSFVRGILVCVSVADILVAWGHFWGITTDLERFLDVYYPGNRSAIYVDQQCSVGAVITIFGTITSFMWTVVLAMLIFVGMKCSGKVGMKFYSTGALAIYHIVCWGIPLIQVSVLGGQGLLGFTDEDVGWCYTQLHESTRSGKLLLQIFSYELWSYITFILLLVFSLWSLCLVRCQCCRKPENGRPDGVIESQSYASYNKASEQTALLSSAVAEGATEGEGHLIQNREDPAQVRPPVPGGNTRNVELKLIAATLSLIILRSFTFVIDIFDYLSEESRAEAIHSWAMILLLPAGIGDSAQGIVNAVLFLPFNTEVRDWFKEKCRLCKRAEKIP